MGMKYRNMGMKYRNMEMKYRNMEMKYRNRGTKYRNMEMKYRNGGTKDLFPTLIIYLYYPVNLFIVLGVQSRQCTGTLGGGQDNEDYHTITVWRS